MNRGKKLLIVLGGVVIVLGVVFSLLGTRKPSAPQVTETENKNPGTVVIDNTDGLHDILLQSQYDVVVDGLITYIQGRVSQTSDHATIQGTPATSGHGLVTFSVHVDKPSKDFSVVLDRSVGGIVKFMVPSDQYSKTLDVYGTYNE